MRKLLWITVLCALLSSGQALAGTKGNTNTASECFEGLSRAIFNFNQGLDKVAFKPIAKIYRILPSPIRQGTGNVVSNLTHVMTIPNNVLQGDFKAAGITTARFVINTTVGIFGIFDPASAMGLNYEKEDYGQTLATWGVPSGCYFVMPILGPTTVRDTVGFATATLGGDPWYNVTTGNDTKHFKDSDYYYTIGAKGIDFRAKNIESFDNLEKNSIDLYASLKSLYLQNRKNQINNSKTITETQDDSDWDDIDSK